MFERIQSWFGSQSKQQSNPISLQADHIPHHVAIIMDGNGRWAKSFGLPRAMGHHSGMKAVKRITIAADTIGVKVLTLYAFSTENWKRPQEEVEYLMKIPQEFLALELDELMEKNVQVRMMGWRDRLPAHTLKAIEEAEAKTRNNTGLVLNLALNYGGRKELLHVAQSLAKEVQLGHLQPEQIDESVYESHLLSKNFPDPDLLIRTSEELRISNFMLWQLAYTELYFTKVYWPAFTEEHFLAAIDEYQRRSRRFGGLS